MLTRIFLMSLVSLLVACGGGNSPGNSNQSPAAPPAATPVTISLAAPSVSFSVRENETSPTPATIDVTWSHASISDIFIAFSNGAVAPGWLSVTRSGTTSPVTIRFEIISTDLAPNTYTASLDVTARDSSAQSLVTETIEISFEVKSAGVSNRSTQDDIFHYGQNIILNGANIAWSDNPGWFNSDIGTADATGTPRTNLPAFESHFSTIANAGGNSARIWLHAESTVTPVIESNGTVSGLSRDLSDAQVVSQLNAILDAAWDEGILVTFNLFSFNMICDTARPVEAKAMLETNLQTYIDAALTPMVSGVKDHPAMFAWDIFNEPEGMSQTDYFCPSSNTVSLETVQRVTNELASAIHELDPNVKVTTSTHTEIYDNYSNSTLLALPNSKPGGTLDFYSLHWYDTGWQVSPHTVSAGEYMADKPIIMGEYDINDTGANGPAAQDAIRTVLEDGYKGAWPWSLTGGDVPGIVSAITEAASLSGAIDKAAIEACIQNKPADCYTQ